MALEDFLEEVTADCVSSHIYELYTWPSSHDLGIESREDGLTLTMDGHDYELKQSLTGLNQKGSTTGYVLWKVSMPFIRWLLESKLYEFAGNSVMELGSGVTGLLSCVLSRKCAHYIASDQLPLLKLLKQNIESNLHDMGSSTLAIPTRGAKKLKGKVDVVEFDWEDTIQGVYNLEQVHTGDLDYILACDVVYNDYLVQHLVNALKSLCTPATVVLMGLQLRAPENIEQFVTELLAQGFQVWRHAEACMSDELQGFVVYYIRRAQIRA